MTGHSISHGGIVELIHIERRAKAFESFMRHIVDGKSFANSKAPPKGLASLAGDIRRQGRSLLGWSVKLSNPAAISLCLAEGLSPSLACDVFAHHTVGAICHELAETLERLCDGIAPLPETVLWTRALSDLARHGVMPPDIPNAPEWLVLAMDSAKSSFESFFLDEGLPSPERAPIHASTPSV